MKKIRNADGKLVAQVNEEKGEVVIVRNDCVTTFQLNKDGQVTVTNTKETVA